MENILIILSVFFFSATSTAEPAANSSRPLVLVSFGVLQSIAKEIGEDHFTFINISEKSDGHEFEPQPELIKNFKKAKGLILNGLDYEPWFSQVKKHYSGPVLIASEGVSRLNLPDPHAWLDPVNGIIYAENIKIFLIKLNPEAKTPLENKFENLRKKLLSISTEAKTKFRTVKNKKVVTSHSSFNYLAKALDLSFYSPQGSNAEQEPSAQDLKNIIEIVRKEKISALFLEYGIPSGTLKTIARETKQDISGTLYSDKLTEAAGPAPDYISLVKVNLDKLYEALK